jgi:hypothetical protein
VSAGEYVSAHHRPPFRADGRVVARREMTLGRVYSAGQELPMDGVTPRQLATWWDQGLVDTLPPVAAKPVQQQQRR